MPSPARTLGSWVRIPLEAWMFFCVYSVFVLSCVSSGLATGWSPVQGVLQTVSKSKIKESHKRRPRPDVGCKRHWMDGCSFFTSSVLVRYTATCFICIIITIHMITHFIPWYHKMVFLTVCSFCFCAVNFLNQYTDLQ
jgi:hypothetical protein